VTGLTFNIWISVGGQELTVCVQIDCIHWNGCQTTISWISIFVLNAFITYSMLIFYLQLFEIGLIVVYVVISETNGRLKTG